MTLIKRFTVGQNLKFLDTWEFYTSKESLEHVQYKFKKKKYDFLKKKLVFDFFSKGGTLSFQNCQKENFRFSKTTMKNVKNEFMGPLKYEDKQSHGFWWS